MGGRVGDKHQIFPEDGHRLAVGDHAVNAYSVNSFYLRCTLVAQGLPGRKQEIDRGGQTP